MLLVTRLADRSDEELMVLLQGQELDALDVLYDRHHRLALALAHRVLGDRDSAEEVVQEAYLAAWRQAATYREDRGNARTWLLSIVRHRAIDRARRARDVSSLSDLDDSLVDQHAPEVWHVASLNLQREQIVRALATLPTEQREAVELAYYGGLTHQEIAERTGVPLGTVKGRTRLAMGKLRTALADLAPETGGRG
jgi:RNA polymerase sigma-70 factor, ECF subfamily